MEAEDIDILVKQSLGSQYDESTITTVLNLVWGSFIGVIPYILVYGLLAVVIGSNMLFPVSYIVAWVLNGKEIIETNPLDTFFGAIL